MVMHSVLDDMLALYVPDTAMSVAMFNRAVHSSTPVVQLMAKKITRSP